MKGRQVAEWRRTVIDLGLVGSYYDDPANQPIWVNNGGPTPAAAELLEALSRADEDGLDTNDYLSGPIIDTNRLANDDDAAGYEMAMSQAFLAFARDIHSGPDLAGRQRVRHRHPAQAGRCRGLAVAGARFRRRRRARKTQARASAIFPAPPDAEGLSHACRQRRLAGDRQGRRAEARHERSARRPDARQSQGARLHRHRQADANSTTTTSSRWSSISSAATGSTRTASPARRRSPP